MQSLRGARERDGLREARLCFDHLAGRAGVALTGGLLARGDLADEGGDYVVTRRGERALAALDIDVEALRRRERPLARPCLDWSERRHHLAGSLGAAPTGELLRRDWLRTREASRAVSVTAAGREALRELFGIGSADLDLALPPRTDHPVQAVPA